MIESNFDFIKTDFPDLFEIGAKAEILYSIDADSCVTKIRLFAEYWLKLFYKRNNVDFPTTATMSDLLIQSEQNRLLSDDLYALLDNIRLKGNMAAHATVSDMSERKQAFDFHKNTLKALLIDAFSLAEYSYKQLHMKGNAPKWQEPEDLSDLRLYKQAFNDNPGALIRIANKKIEQLLELPKDNKLNTRNDAKRLYGDFQMWKARCLAVGMMDVYCLEFLIYSGATHPSLKDPIKLKETEKYVKKNVENKTFHYMKGMHLYNQYMFSQAAIHFRAAIEEGSDECLAELLECYFYSDYQAYIDMLHIGVERKDFNSILLYALYLLTENDDVEDKKIKQMIHHCRSQNKKIGEYLNAIYMCLLDSRSTLNDDNFTPDYDTLASGWELFPDISYASCLSVFYLSKYDKEQLVTKDLLAKALIVGQRTPIYSILLLSAFHVVVYHQENSNPRFGHFDAGSFIRKSAELGFEPAQDIINKYEYRKQFKLKGKRGKPNRKAVKAKRKQNRK